MTWPLKCPGCGVHITLAEYNAANRAGLRKPVCVFCLAKVLKFLQNDLIPLCEGALKSLASDRCTPLRVRA